MVILRNISKSSYCLIVVILLLHPAVATLPATAQTGPAIGDKNEPIYISSEYAEGTEKEFVWEGNVRIIQGKAILRADRITGTLNETGDVTRVLAQGEVRYSDGEQAISGDNAIFNGKNRTLTISQNVIVTQERNVFTAAEAIYWIDSGKVRFRPADGQRVRGIFYTDSQIQLNTDLRN